MYEYNDKQILNSFTYLLNRHLHVNTASRNLGLLQSPDTRNTVADRQVL